MVTVNEPVFIA